MGRALGKMMREMTEGGRRPILKGGQETQDDQEADHYPGGSMTSRSSKSMDIVLF